LSKVIEVDRTVDVMSENIYVLDTSVGVRPPRAHQSQPNTLTRNRNETFEAVNESVNNATIVDRIEHPHDRNRFKVSSCLMDKLTVRPTFH
jgi:hypothetical protein